MDHKVSLQEINMGLFESSQTGFSSHLHKFTVIMIHNYPVNGNSPPST